MKKAVFALIIFIIMASFCYGAETTAVDIEKALDKKALVHPYLFFNGSDKADILKRCAEDPAYGNLLNGLLAEANRLWYAPVDNQAPSIPEDPVFDNTWKYEDFIYNNTHNAWILAFAYQMSGDKKYAQKAFEYAEIVCDQPSWEHGYHKFPLIYDRVWPYGAKDDEIVFTFGQWSDHLVFEMSMVYDWLYPSLEKRKRDRIRGALLEKAILTVRGNYDYQWWASAYRCNWCAVVNSSLGVAALSLLTDDPNLTDVVSESFNRVSRTLDNLNDGGWQEGIGYMNYTVRESVKFAAALKRTTSGKINLFEHPKYKVALKTYLYSQVPPGLSLYFGDSGGGNYGSFNVFNGLALETGDKTSVWLRDNLGYNDPADYLDLFMPRAKIKQSLPKEPSVYFPGVNWIIMRSDFTDTEKFVIAAKAGKNDDPHHGHLDQGHLSLYWRGQEFLSDNGSAVQDKAYFYEDRWSYPQASSAAHNTVIVNGELQIPGKLKNQPWNENIGGKVVEFRPGKKLDYTIIDPTGAYPQKELKGWRRHIILEKPNVAVILDEITCAPGSEIEARFHSSAAQNIGEKLAMLIGSKGKIAVIPVMEK